MSNSSVKKPQLNCYQGLIFKKTRNLFKIKVKFNHNLIIAKLSGKFLKTGDKILVGDYVKFHLDHHNNSGIITERLPRINYLKRPIIANLEYAIILTSFNEPKSDFVFLNKLLIWIHNQPKLTPILIFTKSDLKPSQSDLLKIIEFYRKEYQIIICNYRNGQGLDEVKQAFKGTSALLGKSGVGKSTLLNYLNPNLNLKIGVISKATKTGTHQTTMTQYYEINDQLVADTPGFNNINLSELNKRQLIDYFPFWHNYANNCYFKSCSHLHEKECAIKKAIKSDLILNFFYETYKVIWKNH